MSCNICSHTINNFGCAREIKCKDTICINCAKKCVGSQIRICPLCKKIGTCATCSQYDHDEIKNRKKIEKNNKKFIKKELDILQMCPKCVKNYINGLFSLKSIQSFHL